MAEPLSLKGFLATAGLESFEGSLVEVGCEDVSALRDADEADLREICKEAGMKAGHISKLKRALSSLSVQGAQGSQVPTSQEAASTVEPDWVCEPCQPPVLENSAQAQAQNTVFLDDEERQEILDYVTRNYPLTKILKRLRCEPGSTREKSVTSFYHRTAGTDSLKPEPTSLEQLFVRNQGTTLPLRWYPGRKEDGFDVAKKFRTFLVLGETGTGKTTLLDAFVNCLAGIKLADTWRYKLVNENHFLEKASSESQTTGIASYYIADERPGLSEEERCHTRIIDTPGFGDTGGLAVDQATVAKFKRYFEEELDEVDYILAVVKASESRWTNRAKYVYDHVQQLFGNDAKGRFVLMCTFADGGDCVAAATLKPQLPCLADQYFTFNNSVLYVPHDRHNPTTHMYWGVCMNSISTFLSWVRDENRQAMSLSQAKEVISTRQYLQTSVATGKQLIQEGMSQLDQSVKVLQDIRDNQAKINAYGSYSRTERVEKFRWRKRSDAKPIQFCNTCQKVCCQVCQWPMGYNESQCTYFRGGRGCPKCANCPRSAHRRWEDVDYKESYYVDEVVEDLYKKDELAKGQQGLTFAESLLKRKKEELEKLVRTLLSQMRRVKDSVQKLEQIALKPRVFDDDTYFTELIRTEQENKEVGWEGRVKQLETLRDENAALQKLGSSKSIEDLFPQYQKALSELAGGQSKASCALM